MKAVAVFCGSSNGANETYREGAIALGKELAKREIKLVYGGACVGLMGAIADSVLEAGGEVIGVMPKMLKDKELAHPSLTEMIIVDTMHERKAKMAELADGFIAMPGGAGTLEEFFEVVTWSQIGLHQKPCGLFNTNQFYDPLMAVFTHMVNEQFLQDKFRAMLVLDDNPSTMLDQFKTYIAPGEKIYSKKEEGIL
ncbi:TIGR00730 family Rossman fold protein [Bacillus sp. JJ722]|uniref:LOG family protein n=1 Tax=Bacillus sp. JJ722 TaxID=3122973 RepID=UPI003000D420